MKTIIIITLVFVLPAVLFAQHTYVPDDYFEQALIHYGLSELISLSVDVAITYGDRSFYSKVGFSPLSEEVIKAPLKLSMPEGWLGQSLKDSQISPINERPTCVKEFNNPSYW